MATTKYDNQATWTTPATFASNHTVTATELNTELKDHLNALKNTTYAWVWIDEAADYTISSTSFVDVDATDLSFTYTFSGQCPIEVGFSGFVDNNGANRTYFEVTLDGVAVAGNDGIICTGTSYPDVPVSFKYIIDTPAAGSHTLRLQCKVSGGITTISAGAGTSGTDVHPIFWMREMA